MPIKTITVDNSITMGVYLGIWLIVFLIALSDVLKLEKILQNSLLVFLFVLLLLFIGTRFETGPDIEVYRTYYSQSPLFWEAITNYKEYAYIPVEPLYLLMNATCKSLGMTFNGFLLFYSLLFTVPIFQMTRKYSLMPLFSIMIYYFSGFSVIRQVLAAAVFFYSIQFIITRKLPKFIFCILLASCFHISALILFPLYFLANKTYKAAHIFIAVMAFILLRQVGFFYLLSAQVGVLLSFSPLTSLLFHKFLSYSTTLNSFWGSVTLEWLAIIIFILFNRKSLEKKCPHFNVFFNIFFIGIIMYAFFGAFGDFGRIIIYFKLAYIIVIPAIVTLYDDYRLKFSLICFFSLVVLFRVYISVASDADLPGNLRNRYLPYKTWLLN
jgi:transmembrane protein EpsG